MHMSLLRALLAFGLVGGIFLRPARGDDWPMLGRDATRNPVSPEKRAPTRWQPEMRRHGFLVQPAWNVLWQARLGGNNFASPVIAGGLVWVGTNNSQPRDPQRREDASVLMCFRASDGKFLWQYFSPRLGNQHQDWPYQGLNCSPLVEGDRLWFTTNRCEVVCLDIGPLRAGAGEPRQVWKLDMRRELEVAPVGAAMGIGQTCSVGASYRGRIYVSTGNGVGEDYSTVPAPQAPSLLCLDKETGKVLWSDNSPGRNILYSQSSSPLVLEIKGRAQVIAAQGDGWLRSFDALTGKLIWRFDTNPKAAVWGRGPKATRNYLVATPIAYEGRIYIANGRSPVDYSGESARLYCIDPTKEGDVSPELEAGPGKGRPNPNSAAVWCFEGTGDEQRMHSVVGSVAAHDGLVIAPEAEGYVHCLDARSGRHCWTYDAESGIYGPPLVVGDKVYVGNADGDVTVLALSRELRRLAINELGRTIYSGPVFAGGTLYVATDRNLYALRAGSGSEPPDDWAPGYWPQWRGPERTNVSRETGLLPRWPAEGPPLAWEAQGLGAGAASVAVAAGRVYTLGYRDEGEYLTALEERTGKRIWSVRIGPAVSENPVMRWLSQRTPTADGERLYAVTTRGDLVCLAAADGREIWRKNAARDFAGQISRWGFCDRPLVDGDRLVCAPGGARAAVVALNKRTGETLWECAVPGGLGSGHSTTVVAEVDGLRQYVAFPHGAVLGVAAADGRLLWRYERVAGRVANNHSPVVRDNLVFCASGYGAGLALLKLVPEPGGTRAQEVYFQQQALPPWHDSLIILGDHVYGGTGRDLACFELATGKLVWQERGEVGGTVSVTSAEGRLYLRSPLGKVALVEVTPKGPVSKGTLQIPRAVQKPGATAPVVAGGRLYLRDDDALFCYDVREGTPAQPARPPAVRAAEARPKGQAPGPRSEREPGAVFVPTPQDVVEQMLELARVKKADVVYDLGCGDGRIVVTAARKYGCRAAGCDIDPECVRLARARVEEHNVGRLVAIEQKDLFTLDLSGADVITLYLLPRMNERLLPQLAKLKPGARVVSHAFPIPGVPPDRVVTHTSNEDGVEHKIYLWTAPLKAGRPGK
jgi:outer membrane protein assembly factor BamB